MTGSQQGPDTDYASAHGALFIGLLLFAAIGCGGSESSDAARSSSLNELIIRVGVSLPPSSGGITGLRPLVQNLSSEGLARIEENGRVVPRLAQEWVVADDGRSIKLRLRSDVKFHDGSPVDAGAIVKVLQSTLPQFLGPVFSDIEGIRAVGDDRIEFALRRASPFVQDALEVQVRQPDHPTIGTGPFQPITPDSVVELRANTNYYLGKPTIDRVLVTNYPNVRAAWAELLRDRIDLLYEVGIDALDSLKSGQNVRVFTFTQPYQYVLLFNTGSAALRSPDVRIALSKGIDREALIRDALDGHGLASSGPISPKHWAFRPDFPVIRFEPEQARSGVTGRKVRFTCLVRPNFERMALVLKRQLDAIGVDMVLKEVSIDESVKALANHDYDAMLFDMVSGPTMFRLYGLWHTGGSFNIGQSTGAKADAALDRVRFSSSDEEYLAGVAAFQRAIVDDPPAIFLAWSERARAVSRRFDVAAEPGRDILPTLRLWRPLLEIR